MWFAASNDPWKKKNLPLHVKELINKLPDVISTAFDSHVIFLLDFIVLLLEYWFRATLYFIDVVFVLSVIRHAIFLFLKFYTQDNKINTTRYFIILFVIAPRVLRQRHTLQAKKYCDAKAAHVSVKQLLLPPLVSKRRVRTCSFRKLN